MRRCGLFLALVALAAVAAPAPRETTLPSPTRIAAVKAYVARAWTTLTRSNRDILAAARDPKLPRPPGRPDLVYVSAAEDRARVEAELRQVAGADASRLELRVLPADWRQVREHGLLYLPRPYVVPGGRFNEMYGWDSYFIQLGPLRGGELDLARDLAENVLYQVEHYGTILNANRSYYLSRSQPPFLTGMLLGVFERTGDRRWLGGALPAIDRYYRYWASEPHHIPGLGLARYFDLGEGPAPEVLADERDAAGRSHYDRAREFYRDHAVADYDVARYYDRAGDRLTALFYKGDRSMRESGFDPSNRFGPFSVAIVDHAPVCLNSLLFRMEREAARIHEIVGRPEAAAEWRARAARRRRAIDAHLWDEATGLYLDYDFETGRRRRYEFATTFYPLWVGAASAEQARRVAANLARFEAEGGVLTSTTVTGNQWDAPFGWAPLQLIAVQGLQRYGYERDARRLAAKFVGLVTKEFEEHGVILEKYDLRRRESDVAADIRYGYAANQVGFGWTNAAYLELLALLESSP